MHLRERARRIEKVPENANAGYTVEGGRAKV
jgi:hypothetical protein